MEKLSAPNGKFELRNLINPGLCPQCSEFVTKMWHFVPEEDDRFKVGTSIVISCEACAERTGKR